MTQTLPVPFYILCGSLGAGKTTLLMRLLEFWNSQGHRVGVLMNEAGEVSIDGPRAGTIAEQVLNLAGGCICCDTKDDLAWSITQLVQDYESTVIVLECSGMADPAEVVDAVTDVYVSRIAKLERIFAMLHPVPLPETGMAELVTRNAIRYADDVILNKRDLYIPGHWEQFRQTITRLNPYGRLWETNHARLDVAALLAAPATRTIPTNVSFGKLPAADGRREARAPHHPMHPMVTTVRLPKPLDRKKFIEWTKSLPEGMERAKGFFRFAGEPELQEFQFFPPRTDTIAPVMLLDEPDHVVVLIGRGFDQELCRKSLLACLASEPHQKMDSAEV
ncbi:MAG: cobalamin synthesis protein, P47K [Nitrospira sp.]|jgi:G3E family GTPase|nr:MAG: cobalamin synthesis protein, P47K [Nitrospira sp.]